MIPYDCKSWRWMSGLACILLMFCMSGITSIAQDQSSPAVEPIKLIKCSDHAGKISYKLATTNEHKAMLDEMAKETKFWSKAMAAATKAWAADSTSKMKNFPVESIHHKKIEVVDSFKNQEIANARIQSLEKILKDEEEAEKKQGDSKKKSAGVGMSADARATAQNRRKEEEANRKSLEESAVQMFRDKLVDVSGGELTDGDVMPAVIAETKKKGGKKAKKK